jgi:hypothetical protein
VDEETYDEVKKIFIDAKRLIARKSTVKLTLGQLITYAMDKAIIEFNADEDAFMDSLINEFNEG